MEENSELAAGLVFEDPSAGPAIPEERFFNEAEPKALEPIFETLSKSSVPVIQRAAEDLVAGSLYFNSSQGNPQLFGRRRGRRSVTLSVPTAYLNSAGAAVTVSGIQWAHQRGLVENGSGFQLNPGDSVTIESEGPVFVGPLPGQSAGVIQWLEVFDTWGGPVD